LANGKREAQNSLNIPVYIKLTVLALIALPLFLLILVGSVILKNIWQYEQFVEVNTPLVQETVRNQCQVSDYVAVNRFDNSSDYPPPYYDTLEDGSLRIDCDLANDEWQCTCTEGG
jgi:hypothetical protein